LNHVQLGVALDHTLAPTHRGFHVTNNEIAITAFDAMRDAVVPSLALVHAISQRHAVNEALASQLVDQAIKDGVLGADSMGMVRKV
jgi:hypothetical protein